MDSLLVNSPSLVSPPSSSSTFLSTPHPSTPHPLLLHSSSPSSTLLSPCLVSVSFGVTPYQTLYRRKHQQTRAKELKKSKLLNNGVPFTKTSVLKESNLYSKQDQTQIKGIHYNLRITDIDLGKTTVFYKKEGVSLKFIEALERFLNDTTKTSLLMKYKEGKLVPGKNCHQDNVRGDHKNFTFGAYDVIGHPEDIFFSPCWNHPIGIEFRSLLHPLMEACKLFVIQHFPSYIEKIKEIAPEYLVYGNLFTQVIANLTTREKEHRDKKRPFVYCFSFGRYRNQWSSLDARVWCEIFLTTW
eukprot:TRINITY_DN12156_c0_g1_i1.p1 TRINITY_DN12156_c0_g1~~TRINITY_DN12156_c0_g1_i1.p1  ORF type:complete len:299 (+),score=53.46 TRINITY_DN12156_c0_g1_i1:593-1489(+)